MSLLSLNASGSERCQVMAGPALRSYLQCGELFLVFGQRRGLERVDETVARVEGDQGLVNQAPAAALGVDQLVAERELVLVACADIGGVNDASLDDVGGR